VSRASTISHFASQHIRPIIDTRTIQNSNDMRMFVAICFTWNILLATSRRVD